MKKKWIGIYLGLAVTAMVAITVPAAAEATDTTQAEEVKEQEPITLDMNGTQITVLNKTEAAVESAQIKEEKKEGEESSFSVILTMEDKEHTFENVTPDKWKDAELTLEYGFFYIQYTDDKGVKTEAVETAEAVAPDKEMTMWATTDVNVREGSDLEAKVLKVAALGGECKIKGILPGWFQVEYDGTEGYISHKFLSEDKAAVDAAVLKAEEERAAAAAAAAAAQAQQNEYSYSYSGSDNNYSYEEPVDNSSSEGGQDSGECLTGGLLN